MGIFWCIWQMPSFSAAVYQITTDFLACCSSHSICGLGVEVPLNWSVAESHLVAIKVLSRLFFYQKA